MVAMENDIARIIITERNIRARVAALADEISDSYANTQADITIVTVLSGAVIFLADLVRRMPMRMKMALVSVSSYPGAATQSRGATLTSSPLPDLGGRDVLIIDDILDSGGTLRLVQRQVRNAEPHSIKTAVLLRKPGKAPDDVMADFVGFDVEDAFVVGYGLDFDGLYRNLPYIGVLRPELYGQDGGA